MRILVDVTAANERSGGVATYVAGLFKGWRELSGEDELELIGTRELASTVPEPLRGGGIKRIGTSGALSRFTTQQVRLPRIIEQMKPQVLFSTSQVLPLISAKVPAVAVVHDMRHLQSPQEFRAAQVAYRALLYHLSFHRAKALIATSEITRQHLERACAGSREKTFVIYHGADHVDEWRSDYEGPSHAIAFAHWTNKRPEIAIRAWAKIRNAVPRFAYVLHIVGSRPRQRRQLARLARELAVGDLTEIHAFLPPSSFRSLFVSARLVILPSSLEGFGLPVVEAMRLRIPVVVSRGAGMEEAGGDAALYADSASVDDFARWCKEALLDGPVRHQAIERGYKRASQFKWRNAAEQTRRVLERTAASS